jgi:hypothetical protein
LFEAAKRSLLIADTTLKRLDAELKALEPDILASVNIGERAVPALLSCITFVDFAFRYGEVVDQLPTLSKKESAMRDLKVALKPIGVARNHLQHLRGDLSSNEGIDYPLLGSIAWASGDRCFVSFLTQPTVSSVPTIQS